MPHWTQAYENGDMTQAGVLAAAKSLENVDFNGLAPDGGVTPGSPTTSSSGPSGSAVRSPDR